MNEEEAMLARWARRRLSRRDVLRAGGLGALAVAAGGAVVPGVLARSLGSGRAAGAQTVIPASPDPEVFAHLAATDGHILLPGRGSLIGGGVGDPVYVFGFVRVPNAVTPDELDVFKGAIQLPAPIISVDEETDVYLTMTNIGLVVRPDLDDSHTIHWHGFPNATAIFDGVPEVSIAVPVGRDFPYYYKPHRAGTFMYHCHFEDVEHVQMGMTGTVFVRPAQNGTSLGGFTKFAYNDGDGSTGFDREFALLLNEIWTTPHDNLEAIQETVWPEYAANYWTINARSYPDTLLPNNHSDLPSQPLSSLIQVEEGDRVLLRFANLGYEQQAMQLPGIRMTVVGEDAAMLRGPGGADLSYDTSTIYIGPGEGRDVLFTAPDYDGTLPHETDDFGNYNVYTLKNRNLHRLTNGGMTGLGGQVTEVWVYEDSSLADQTHPNETYPEPAPTAPYLDPWIV
jgi:FtsP/CotA-like multicopper oxidase with cupredoxin domain